MKSKLAAILSADMVGYLWLMEVGEARTPSHHKSLRSELLNPNISGHGGWIVKSTADGTVVDSARPAEAARCVVETEQFESCRVHERTL